MAFDLSRDQFVPGRPRSGQQGSQATDLFLDANSFNFNNPNNMDFSNLHATDLVSYGQSSPGLSIYEEDSLLNPNFVPGDFPLFDQPGPFSAPKQVNIPLTPSTDNSQSFSPEQPRGRSMNPVQTANYGIDILATKPSPHSARSSADSLTGSHQPSTLSSVQSPRPQVMVSCYDQDGVEHVASAQPQYSLSPQRSQGHSRAPSTTRTIASDVATHDGMSAILFPPRDSEGNWLPSEASGTRGLNPNQRTGELTESLNETNKRRNREERNINVNSWLEASTDADGNVNKPASPVENVPSAAEIQEAFETIPLGNNTENKLLADQTYINCNATTMDDTDLSIIQKRQAWEEGPRLHAIDSRNRFQPQSSADAIAMYRQRMAQSDADSVVSFAATLGTIRRRSISTTTDFNTDEHEITSGSLLKRLNLRDNRPSHHRGSSFFQTVGNLIRSPSSGGNKRTRSKNRESSSSGEVTPTENDYQSRDSISINRSGSTRHKVSPSIGTLVASVGGSAAAIGLTHARPGSISGTVPSVTTPTSSSLSFSYIRTSLKRTRGRSKSDVGRSSDGSPVILDMPKREDGAPGAAISSESLLPQHKLLVTSSANSVRIANKAGVEDTDDEEELEDDDMERSADESNNIEPTFEGFKAHIRWLNPEILPQHDWLVDRIATHQVNRYKYLVNLRLKHLRLGTGCPNGKKCEKLDGAVILLNQKGQPRNDEDLGIASDDDIMLNDGSVSQESFPKGIPMPPTNSLPAEFECRLCFVTKKFNKPSDWTKHVQEDVQPFTCTWDRCKDPKMFKRKADWVRHENEGHRHLEWWQCDVPECSHVCYRRDNFLQHLVREHKCLEPRFKTKAQKQKYGGPDPTNDRVDACHRETQKSPLTEYCRFCNKNFPVWKKLNVHMAKHLEQISLPVIKLAQKDIHPDLIISPAHEVPPRQFPTAPSPEHLATLKHGAYHQTASMNNAAFLQNMDNFGSLNGNLGNVLSDQFAMSQPVPNVNGLNSMNFPNTAPLSQNGFPSPTPLMTNFAVDNPPNIGLTNLSPPDPFLIHGGPMVQNGQIGRITPQAQSSPAQSLIHNMGLSRSFNGGFSHLPTAANTNSMEFNDFNGASFGGQMTDNIGFDFIGNGGNIMGSQFQEQNGGHMNGGGLFY